MSDDGQPGDNLTYEWSVVSGGKDAGRFKDPNAVRTIATFSRVGAYVLKLTADDGALTGAHTLTIRVR